MGVGTERFAIGGFGTGGPVKRSRYERLTRHHIVRPSPQCRPRTTAGGDRDVVIRRCVSRPPAMTQSRSSSCRVPRSDRRGRSGAGTAGRHRGARAAAAGRVSGHGARTVSAQALVAFRGNTYSVPPGLAGAKVTVSHRLAVPVLDIATTNGTVLARHRRELDGAGVAVRDRVHVRRWRPRCRPRSTPPGPARARSGAHRARPRSPRPNTGTPATTRSTTMPTWAPPPSGSPWSTSRSGLVPRGTGRSHHDRPDPGPGNTDDGRSGRDLPAATRAPGLPQAAHGRRAPPGRPRHAPTAGDLGRRRRCGGAPCGGSASAT